MLGFMRYVIGFAALAALVFFITLPERATLSAQSVRVIDGDTIEVAGDRYRLTGYDTPETYRAQCASEKKRGDQATLRMRELVRSGGRIELLSADGRDKYGRRLGKLYVDGRDVGVVMIDEGLAHSFTSGKRQSWCDTTG